MFDQTPISHFTFFIFSLNSLGGLNKRRLPSDRINCATVQPSCLFLNANTLRQRWYWWQCYVINRNSALKLSPIYIISKMRHQHWSGLYSMCIQPLSCGICWTCQMTRATICLWQLFSQEMGSNEPWHPFLISGWVQIGSEAEKINFFKLSVTNDFRPEPNVIYSNRIDQEYSRSGLNKYKTDFLWAFANRGLERGQNLKIEIFEKSWIGNILE